MATDILSARLDELVAEVHVDTAAYFARRPSDGDAAMELFRRAILDGDEGAWSALYDAYLPLVLGWVGRHPSVRGCGEDLEYLANRAFERFWRAVRAERLARFPNLRALLGYLKLCATCAVVDAARANRDAECRDLDDAEGASEDRDSVERAEALLGAEQLWRTVVEVLPATHKRFAWEVLVLGMTPRQVLAAHPADWGSIKQVYEAKAGLLRRLRTSPKLAELRPAGQQCAAGRAS
jgi:hypothetical protein